MELLNRAFNQHQQNPPLLQVSQKSAFFILYFKGLNSIKNWVVSEL